jgi:hypothetical protein
MHDVQYRLRAVEIYDPDLKLDVFLCRSDGLYRFLARLTLVPSEVPGFNLSQARNSFLSLTGIEERRRMTGGFPKYSAIGGGLAHNITHELVHNYAVARHGFLASREIPAWKSEGYAEYAAGRAARESDSNATLKERINIFKYHLFNEGARKYYSYGLLIEYLSDVEGYSFDDIMADRSTFEQVFARMMAWHDQDHGGV